MKTKMKILTLALSNVTLSFGITVLFVVGASGQTLNDNSQERVLHFTHLQTERGFEDVAKAIKFSAGVEAIMAATKAGVSFQISVDKAARALVLRGPAGQMAIAEWLFNELDRLAGMPIPAPPSNVANSNALERRLPALSASRDRDMVVRVFATHTETDLGLIEIVNAIRVVTDIGFIVPCYESRALVLQGPADNMALAEWLINKLDQPAGMLSAAAQRDRIAPTEYRIPGSNDEVVQVLFSANDLTSRGMVDLSNAIRATTGTHRVAECTSGRIVVMRGTRDQLAQADLLVRATGLGSPEHTLIYSRSSVQSFPLYCQGPLTTTSASPPLTSFKWAGQGAGAASPGPGECAWADRAPRGTEIKSGDGNVISGTLNQAANLPAGKFAEIGVHKDPTSHDMVVTQVVGLVSPPFSATPKLP